MSTKHTPLPWTRNKCNEIVDADGNQVRIAGIGFACVSRSVKTDENEERILLAVNSHDKLVAALRSAIELMEQEEFATKTLTPKLREVLAAAEAQ